MSQPPVEQGPGGQEPGWPEPSEEPSWVSDEHADESESTAPVEDDTDRVARLERLVERLVSSIAQSPGTASPDTASESSRKIRRLETTVRDIAQVVVEERDRVKSVAQSVSDDREANAERFRQLQKAITPPEDLAAPQEQPGPTPWTERATSQQWHDLAQWVDWLADTYEVRGHATIHPCWPAHLGVVEELAALWDSWRDAATRSALDGLPPGDNDALAFWHDRYLAPTVTRLHGLYLFHACKNGHQAPIAAQKTDADLLPPLE